MLSMYGNSTARNQGVSKLDFSHNWGPSWSTNRPGISQSSCAPAKHDTCQGSGQFHWSVHLAVASMGAVPTRERIEPACLGFIRLYWFNSNDSSTFASMSNHVYVSYIYIYITACTIIMNVAWCSMSCLSHRHSYRPLISPGAYWVESQREDFHQRSPQPDPLAPSDVRRSTQKPWPFPVRHPIHRASSTSIDIRYITMRYCYIYIY